jgi:hypothetical protein
MADVSWTEQHDWGLGTCRPTVVPERVRVRLGRSAIQPSR